MVAVVSAGGRAAEQRWGSGLRLGVLVLVSLFRHYPGVPGPGSSRFLFSCRNSQQVGYGYGVLLGMYTVDWPHVRASGGEDATALDYSALAVI
jgi:hypothetical protein